MSKLTIAWLKAAGIRAIRTMAQTAVGMIAVGAALNQVDWFTVLSVSLVAGILSILTSVATGLPELSTKSTDIITPAIPLPTAPTETEMPIKESSTSDPPVKTDETNQDPPAVG